MKRLFKSKTLAMLTLLGAVGMALLSGCIEYYGGFDLLHAPGSFIPRAAGVDLLSDGGETQELALVGRRYWTGYDQYVLEMFDLSNHSDQVPIEAANTGRWEIKAISPIGNGLTPIRWHVLGQDSGGFSIREYCYTENRGLTETPYEFHIDPEIDQGRITEVCDIAVQAASAYVSVLYENSGTRGQAILMGTGRTNNTFVVDDVITSIDGTPLPSDVCAPMDIDTGAWNDDQDLYLYVGMDSSWGVVDIVGWNGQRADQTFPIESGQIVEIEAHDKMVALGVNDGGHQRVEFRLGMLGPQIESFDVNGVGAFVIDFIDPESERVWDESEGYLLNIHRSQSPGDDDVDVFYLEKYQF